MSFQFPLEPLLRFRNSQEDLQRQRLIKLQQELVKNSQQINVVTHSVLALKEKVRSDLKVGSRASQLHFAADCRLQLETMLLALKKQRTILQERRDAQQRQYLSARKEHQVIERLKEKARQEYELQEARQQQAATDEMFLHRQRFKTGHK